MTRNFQAEAEQLIAQQVENWELAKVNYAQLKEVVVREISINESTKFIIQHNPKRIMSSTAKVDDDSIRQRACFLCSSNLPPQQKAIHYKTNYLLLVNPYPIFNHHLTIVSTQHTPQLIENRFLDMLQIAQTLNNFVVFYNGPKCGASAPDHFHFQAGNKGFLPVEDEFFTQKKTLLTSENSCHYYAMDNYLRKTLVMVGSNPQQLLKWFNKTLSWLKSHIPPEPEPMVNIVANWNNEQWQVFIFPRQKHRPYQYFAEGNEQVLISPASVDFGGVITTPRKEDFEKLNSIIIQNIFEQVTISEAVWIEMKKQHHF